MTRSAAVACSTHDLASSKWTSDSNEKIRNIIENAAHQINFPLYFDTASHPEARLLFEVVSVLSMLIGIEKKPNGETAIPSEI